MALLILSLAACGTETPDTPDVPGTTEPNMTEPNADDPDVTNPAVQDPPITAEDLVGCYQAKDEADSYIQIRQWGDCFTIEYLVYDSDGFAWLWAEEIWPTQMAGPPRQDSLWKVCLRCSVWSPMAFFSMTNQRTAQSH